jgi:RNA 3'-terminal phosphate cyclase (ATP)
VERILKIDGSLGEGGGQVLRTALALSALRGTPVEIEAIRAGRPRPGLAPQHLVSVRALAQLCEADVQGAELRSGRVVFRPGRVRGGEYRFDIGTAGSVSLVLHAVTLPLALGAREESRLVLTGGTDVEWSPTFDYMAGCWVPAMAGLGIEVELERVRSGYYPEGGGEVHARIHPAGEVRPVTWLERGRLQSLRVRSHVANLPLTIAERQARAAERALRAAGRLPDESVTEERKAMGKGSAVAITASYEKAQAIFTALGRRGKRAEEVGEEAARAFLRHHRSRGCVDPRLADQLVPPLALAGGPSSFTTSQVTEHLRTNAEVVSVFVPMTLRIEEQADEQGVISVEPETSPQPDSD